MNNSAFAKRCLLLRVTCLAAAAAVAFSSSSNVAGARLYHVPLGGRNVDQVNSYNHHSRSLAADQNDDKGDDDDDVDQDNLYQARGVQYTDLKVGCPAQTQSAIISTASSAIGFPCSGCTDDCGEGSHLHGFYHEKQSTCFSQVPCGDCYMQEYSCTHKQCPVRMSYMEGSSFYGFEVEDMISVGGENDDDEAYPLRFGCQTDITGLFEGQIPDGIFGMNKEKGSAISQWSKLGYLEDAAFSLCYNVREDVKKKSGVMVLGGPDERLHEKPMVFAKDVGTINYEVRIKEISLRSGSGVKADVPGTTASLGLNGTDTATLDSGTTCTFLDRKWREALLDAWRQVTGGKYEMFTHLHITDSELNELPTLVFELEGEDTETISVEYPPIRYMEKSEYGNGWGFCMFAQDSSDTVTLGNTFMAGHDVLHDIDKHRIGFAESKCKVSTAIPQVSITADADAGKSTPNDKSPKAIKQLVLQSEPVHRRKPEATTPLLGLLYGALAVGVIVIGFVLYRCQRHSDSKYWSEPNTKHAFQLSIISLVLTILAILAGMALFSSTGSSLYLVFGLENCVDFISSVVVLWRFFAPTSLTEELELKLKAREKRASIAISMILVLLGFGILITAIEDLLRGQEQPHQQKAALVISFFSFVCLTIMMVFKFHYGKALESPSLKKDGICSLIGTVLSISLFINTFIIYKVPSAWWIDPTVAIVCGFASLVYGIISLRTARKMDMKDTTEMNQEEEGRENEPGFA